MRKPAFDESWPEIFKQLYIYDDLEVWGDISNLGYVNLYRGRHKPIIDAVKERLLPGALLLDVAAAGGNFSLPLAEIGYRVTWNDLRHECMDWVKKKYERGVISYVVGNIFEQSARFRDHFDGVIATEVIEHVAHPDQFLANLATMVKPGGWIFLTTPNGRYFRNPLPKFSDCPDPSIFESAQFKPNSDGHIFLLHPSEIEEMAARCGLRIDQAALATNALSAGHIKFNLVLPYLPRSFVNFVETNTRKLPRSLRERLHATMIVILQKQ